MLCALIDIAHKVGKYLLEWREQGGCNGEWEGTQFKAEADSRAHAMWAEALIKLAPEIPIISEEDTVSISAQRPPLYFLIDPIDGTASYAHGFSGFVTQVALIEAGRIKFAAVHAPMLNLTWHASFGKGAFLGESRLSITPSSERLLVIDNYPEPRGIADILVKQLPATGYVECGSIGLKACRVADGTADLFVKDILIRDWDIAPADLILHEAGAYISDASGHALCYGEISKVHGLIVARNAIIASKTLHLLKENYHENRSTTHLP